MRCTIIIRAHRSPLAMHIAQVLSHRIYLMVCNNESRCNGNLAVCEVVLNALAHATLIASFQCNWPSKLKINKNLLSVVTSNGCARELWRNRFADKLFFCSWKPEECDYIWSDISLRNMVADTRRILWIISNPEPTVDETKLVENPGIAWKIWQENRFRSKLIRTIDAHLMGFCFQFRCFEHKRVTSPFPHDTSLVRGTVWFMQ